MTIWLFLLTVGVRQPMYQLDSGASLWQRSCNLTGHACSGSTNRNRMSTIAKIYVAADRSDRRGGYAH